MFDVNSGVNITSVAPVWMQLDVQRMSGVKSMSKGRFTRYDFCLRLSHAIFVARAARVIKKIVCDFYDIKLPVATIVVGF